MNTLRRQWLTITIPLLLALLSAFFWRLRDTSVVSTLAQPLRLIEWNGYDFLFWVRGAQPKEVDSRITIVGFDVDSATALKTNGWPPPRHFHADLLKNIARDKPKAIVFDVVFAEATTQGEDKILDAALKEATCPVILATRIHSSSAEQSERMESLYYDDKLGFDFEEKAKIAFTEVALDSVGTEVTRGGDDAAGSDVIRTIFPLRQQQGEWLPSLAAATYLTIHNTDFQQCKITKDAIQVGDLVIPKTGQDQGRVVKTNQNNALPTAYIDFPMGADMFPILRYDQVALGQTAAGTFTEKIVFVGLTDREFTSNGKKDEFRTAYSHFNPENTGGKNTSTLYGVVIQAQMLNAMTQKLFITHAAPWQTGLLVFAFALLATYGVRTYMNWRGPVSVFVAILAYLVCVYLAFTLFRLYIPYVVPGIGMAATLGVIAYFERGHLRKQWGGYVSPAYLEAMIKEGVDASPKRQMATVIFGDIRGFTSFSEKHEPELVVRLLNLHLGKLVKIVHDNGGAVDKFLGDGILAVFGAPTPKETATRDAIRAVWAMKQASELPLVDTDGKSYPFGTGFGITTGELVCGNVGSQELKSFTLIGDTVNLASRLQGLTGQPDIIIDATTYEQVKDMVEVEFLGEVTLKGKAHPVPSYKVTKLL
jgi:adenylate cyclase